MAFAPARCTSCGGEIQLDDLTESGFCLYCGNELLVKDAVQMHKIQVSGKEDIEGISINNNPLQRAPQIENIMYPWIKTKFPEF